MSVDDPQGTFFTPKHNLHFIRWHPSTPGTVKLNFEGSLQGKSATDGYILRDWREALLLLGALNYGDTSVTMAESHALQDGLQEAIRRGFSRLEIEGDNSLVIGASLKQVEVPWRIKNVIQDIQTLAQKAEQVRFMHVYREANMAADWLSKLGHSITDTWVATASDNVELQEIIQSNRMGRTPVRRGT